MSKKTGKVARRVSNVDVDNSKVKFKARQSATASIGQGGNAIAINANELGNIRPRSASGQSG